MILPNIEKEWERRERRVNVISLLVGIVLGGLFAFVLLCTPGGGRWPPHDVLGVVGVILDSIALGAVATLITWGMLSS